METLFPPIEDREIEHMTAQAHELLGRLEFVAEKTLNDTLLEQSAVLTIRLAEGVRTRTETIETLRAQIAEHGVELNAALQEVHEIYRETMDRQNAQFQAQLKSWQDGYSSLETQLSKLKARHAPTPEALVSTQIYA